MHTRARRSALTLRPRNLSEVVGSILNSEVMGTVRTHPMTSERIIINVYDIVLSVIVDYQMIGGIGRMVFVQTCFKISISCGVRIAEIATFHTQGVTLGLLLYLVIRTISTSSDNAVWIRLGTGWLCCGIAVCQIYYPRVFGIFNISLVQKILFFLSV